MSTTARARGTAGRIAVRAVLTAGAVVMLLPFAWMVLTSLKSLRESIAVPPAWLPAKLQWGNYAEAMRIVPLMLYLRNTALVASVNTVLTLAVTALAAFPLARLEFRGKSVLFAFLLVTMMVPGEMLIIQNYVTVSKLGWIDTYAALIVPWIASVFYIFLLRQYFLQIPDQLYHAARVDGCRDWKYLWRIMIPNAKSAMVTIAILNFIASWNAFLWPLLVTNSDERRVLSIGLTRFTTEAGSEVHLQMAAATIMVAPMVAVFLVLRRYVIEGVTRSGIKG